MLDHVFTDAIGAMRDALEAALLERQAFEERFQTDVLLGDLSFDTSYALPGEGSPPAIQADLHLAWSTWSQAAYRSWYIEEPVGEQPTIEIEITFRIQRLDQSPDPASVVARLDDDVTIGTSAITRSNPVVEAIYHNDMTAVTYGALVSYEGSYELSDAVLDDGSVLDEHFTAIGGWIAAMLVRLGDVRIELGAH